MRQPEQICLDRAASLRLIAISGMFTAILG
jgi:hypothetical protein